MATNRSIYTFVPGYSSFHVALICILIAAALDVCAVKAADGGTNIVTVMELENTVEIQRYPASDWDKAYVGQQLKARDRGRTGAKSRALVQMYDLSVVRIGENSLFEVEPALAPQQKATFNLWKGVLYFFSRDKPIEANIRTPTAAAAIRGTEFVLQQDENGRTVLTLLDGKVVLSNLAGQSITLTNHEQGIVVPGKPPTKTAVIEAINDVQWCLYYPAILDLDELGLSPEIQTDLRDSLAAYRSGDLLQALAKYPENRHPKSRAETIYSAELFLSVGLEDRAEEVLKQLDHDDGNIERMTRLANALNKLTAAVKLQKLPPDANRQSPPLLATEWLAESYCLQSQAQLEQALAAARKATEISPQFGFAWARVAELEFSFGRISSAQTALDKSLALAPRNAEAIALKGFLLSAKNRVSEATTCFDDAIAIDGALGNAWLGRGLCRIRRGQLEDGRADLQVAAALEPNRSFLRSYLGKAWNVIAHDALAMKELELAKELDPRDPTPWLYSALVNRELNRVNPAVDEMERSVALNDNRRVYRSQFLLDEDRAVRSSGLASTYQDAGMDEVSVREASKAVTYDYSNPSAHLFLADSYNQLRDPTRFNLRYETVWFNELLLANLLAPVGAGRLSQEVSAQEYTRMFESDGLSLASSSDVRSDGMFHEAASQFGTFGNTSYSLDLDYQHNNGIRVNNDLDDIEWYSTIKQQITPHDTALLLVKYENYHSGDNFQYYNQSQARPNYRFDEYQEPILVGGWNHEWSPRVHTLLLAGRLINEQNVSDQATPQLLLTEDPSGNIYATGTSGFDVKYHSAFEIYSAELNQICEWNRVTLSLGARYQAGTFQTQDLLNNPTGLGGLFNNPPAAGSADDGFQRVTGYGYATVEPFQRFWLTAGLAYDDVRFPDNFRQPPISSGENTRSQLGPKAALVWSPLSQLTLRGIYTRSLGGVSLDESYRLEPVQLAGFPQAFRSLISESVVGSVSAPAYETLGLALDLKLGPRTYAGVQVERLKTSVNRDVGVFTLVNGLAPFVPDSTPEQLNYTEYALDANFNQLLGNDFAIGADYRLTQADLHDVLPDVPVSALATADQTEHARMHQVSSYVLFNHPSGVFAKAELVWYKQENWGYATPMPGDDFFQENLYVGYRFAHRHAELMLGFLNLGGQDYQLNPLTEYSELPRSRVIEARLSFVF